MDYTQNKLYRPAKRTLLSFEEVADAIPIAFERSEGKAPTLKTVAKLLAQSSLETGNYQHMWNFNFGNVKKRWSPDDGSLFTMFRCNEILGGKVEWFDPPHLQTHFRRHVELEEARTERRAVTLGHDQLPRIGIDLQRLAGA